MWKDILFLLVLVVMVLIIAGILFWKWDIEGFRTEAEERKAELDAAHALELAKLKKELTDNILEARHAKK